LGVICSFVAVDAHSFSNSFEGLHGVVGKYGVGSPIFGVLHTAFNSQVFWKFFEGVHGVVRKYGGLLFLCFTFIAFL
jgi:hypothetical protein